MWEKRRSNLTSAKVEAGLGFIRCCYWVSSAFSFSGPELYFFGWLGGWGGGGGGDGESEVEVGADDILYDISPDNGAQVRRGQWRLIQKFKLPSSTKALFFIYFSAAAQF